MQKYFYFLFLILISLQSCQTISKLEIETIIPSEINFPVGNFNKIVFVNLENDYNDDNQTDTMLYKIITGEMNAGFLDAMNSSIGIDSSNYFFVKGYPKKNKLYKLDTISWYYLDRISGYSDADIFIILDSLNLSMVGDVMTEYYYVPVEYYKYREISIDAHWSVFNAKTKKRLDKYNYTDTLLWDAIAYSEEELKKEMVSVERSLREASYFIALDYANRIFPSWKAETRYYYITGNKDFRAASEFVKNNEWEKASLLWEKYTNNIDKEIASRAYYNLAFAYELTGNIEKAIMFAKESNKIKSKARTRNYISILINRQSQVKKLQKQIY